MSNANDTVCAIRKTRWPCSASTGSKIRRWWLISMFVSPAYSVTTPLGFPVEPEV